MKAVLVSIHPKWVGKILDEKKTIEVRKTRPKIETPFKCYIYCTNGDGVLSYHDYCGFDMEDFSGDFVANMKVVAEFTCDKIISTCGWRLTGDTGRCAPRTADEATLPKLSRLTLDELLAYAGSPNRLLYGWHISDLKVYDKPKELYTFYKECPGLDNTGMCYDCEMAVGEECDCTSNGRLFLTRPPQSWCYVEDKA